MVEIYGREASGKTTLALHIIKEAQKLGGLCYYLIMLCDQMFIKILLHETMSCILSRLL